MTDNNDDLIFKVLRLSNGPDDIFRKVLPYASIRCGGEEYIYVRPLNDEETFCFGNYIFQRIISFEKNQIKCETIKEPEMIYRLFTLMVSKYRLYEQFEKNMDKLADNEEMYCLLNEEQKGEAIQECFG